LVLSYFVSFLFIIFLKKGLLKGFFTNQTQSFVVTNITPKNLRGMLTASLGDMAAQFSEVIFLKESNWHAIGKFLFKR